MANYTYFVISEKNQNNNYFAHAEKICNNDNLLNFFHPCPNCELLHINACETLKKAKELADSWNTAYRTNGRYAFQR